MPKKRRYKMTCIVTYEVEARDQLTATTAAMWVANGNAPKMPAVTIVGKAFVEFKGLEVQKCEEQPNAI